MLNFDHTKPIDFTCIGRANVDLYALEEETALENVSGFQKSVGGSPANIAVGISRLGGVSSLITKVKNDPLGRYVVGFLNREGVNTSNIIMDEGDTLTSIAFVEVCKGNSEVVFYRENASDIQLEFEELDQQLISNSKGIIVSGTSLSNKPSSTTICQVIDKAKSVNTRVIFDIDYRSSVWDTESEASKNCWHIACESDMVIGNKEEFELLKSYQETENFMSLFNQLFNYGVNIVIFKDAENGSRLYSADGGQINQSIFQVNMVKPYGSGDAFLAAICFAMNKGENPQECLRLGAASAAIVVSKRGCAIAMPALSEIKKFMKEYNHAKAY